MKINHNMSAVIANKQLLRTENGLTSSLERLSSGLRINHASDDAAGMAIASKMNAQIKGLNQASRNASDGVSVLDTADGALNEVASMLQRMRELSVQAANETNTETDLKAIQAEITSLTDEIDRVSKDTEYNTMNLLDGTQDTRVYPSVRGIERIDISDNVEKGVYNITVNAPAEHAVGEGNTAAATTTVTAAQEGKVVINGVEVEINEGDTFTQVYEKLRAGAETGNVNLLVVADTTATGGTAENAGYVPTDVAAGGTLVFVSKQYGSAAELNISCENTALAAYLGIPANGYTEHGADADVSFAAGDNGFTTQATMTTEGTHVKVTDRSGFEMNFEVMPDVAGDVSLEVTDIGKKYVELHAADSEEAMSGMVQAIADSNKKIQDLKAQIQIIKGVVRCENCGAEVAKESAFCPSCGNKMPEIVQPVVEQPVAEAKKCANCGATLDNGALFCSECGTKVE